MYRFYKHPLFHDNIGFIYKKMANKINYSEPKDYIPKDLRKKYGLGEFAQDEPKKDEKRAKENEELRKVFKGK